VCDHAQRGEIDRALAAGVSYRTLEEQYAGVSRSALSRHAQHSDQAPLPAAEPPVSLCPPQDPAEQASQRTRLVDAVTAARQQLATITDAIDVHAVELARMLAMEANRAFQPLRSDDDLRPMAEYQRWMERPKVTRDTMETLLTSWRQALHGLQRAQWALAAHDQKVREYERQHRFLGTPTGQEMETRYRDLHTAIAAAHEVGNERLKRVYTAEVEKLKQDFVQAVFTTTRQAA
jgi:hypothetical protein